MDNTLSMHIDNRNKDILVLSEGPDGLDDTTITTKAKYSVIITKSRKKICLSFLYAKGIKILQFKTSYSEIKSYPLLLGNVSKVFTVSNMQKTGLNGTVYHFLVSHETIDITDFEDIHKYLIKKHNIL